MNELSHPEVPEEAHPEFIRLAGKNRELELREIRDVALAKRERFWLIMGKTGAIATLATIGILFNSSYGHKMKSDEKVGYGAIGALGAAVLAGGGWSISHAPRSKAQQNALEAQHISISVNGTMLPWIEKRLDQRLKDQIACGVNPFFEEDRNNKERAKKFTE